MGGVWVGPAHLDSEVLALDAMGLERLARVRAEQVVTGLAETAWWTERLRQLDAALRLRWDFQFGWTIDRWAEGCWNVVGVLGHHQVRTDLIDYLRRNDMQRWPSPEAYLAHKRAAAERVAQANDKRNTDKVNAAVERMSEKGVREFIEVERAIQTGETIVARGETEKMLNRMASASRAAGQTPEPEAMRSTNPAYHPRRLTRAKGGKHVTA